MRQVSYFAPMAGWFLAAACAQEPTATAPPAEIDARGLRGARWTYQSSFSEDGSIGTPVMRSTISLTSSSLDGEPAWMIVTEFRRGAQDRWIDTLLAGQRDLTPLYRSLHFLGRQPRLLIGGTFAPDALGLSFHDLRRDSVLTLPSTRGPLVVSDGQLPILTQLLPLNRTWAGSFVRWGAGPGARAVDVRVVGEGRIEVPAGDFDCWTLEERRAPGDHWTFWWIDKRTGWLIKLEQRGQSSLVTNVLVSAEPLERE